jgi:hypothetical protein
MSLFRSRALLMATVWTVGLAVTGCASQNPLQPSPANPGGTLERRVGDVSGAGTFPPPDCVPGSDCDTTYDVATVTLATGDGSSLVLECAFTLLGTSAADLYSCNFRAGDGRFENAEWFDTYVEKGQRVILDPFRLDGSTLTVALGLISPTAGPTLTEGTLDANVKSLDLGSCQSGSKILDLEFSGILPRYGKISGTIAGVCG